MCTSYEFPEQSQFEAFSFFPTPSFTYRDEIYKDYVAPIFRRINDQFCTDPATFWHGSADET